MKRSFPAGFTLIEVLIAIVVISLGVLAWVAAQNSNIQSRDKSSRLTVGIDLAQSCMEDISEQAMDWSRLHGDDSGNFDRTIDGVTYSTAWNATAGRVFPEGSATWLICVSVRWNHWKSYETALEKLVAGK